MSYYFFFHNVFKSRLLQRRQKWSVCGKGLNLLHFEKYSQTCDQQPPKGHDKTGCLRQVAAEHKCHDLVGFVQVLSVHIILHVTVRNTQ